MDRIFSKKFDMLTTTMGVVDENGTIWLGDLPYTSLVAKIKAKMVLITEKDQLDRDTKSATATKKQVFEDMYDATEVICGAGMSYANSINDEGLKLKFNFSRSDLKAGTEKEAVTHCVNVYAAALPLEADLVTFNMPITQLLDQKALTTKASKLIASPQKVRTGGKSAREEMIILFGEVDVLLKDGLDGMMKTYKKLHPNFFLEYNNARFIGGWKKKKIVPPVTGNVVKVKTTTKVETTPIYETSEVDETPVVETETIIEPIPPVEPEAPMA